MGNTRGFQLHQVGTCLKVFFEFASVLNDWACSHIAP